MHYAALHKTKKAMIRVLRSPRSESSSLIKEVNPLQGGRDYELGDHLGDFYYGRK